MRTLRPPARGGLRGGGATCPDDLDAAYGELDARYAAGEAAPYARTWAALQRVARAVAARDWEQWASVFAPDLVVEDHRLLGWETLHSRDAYLKPVRTLLDLSPDARWRLDHVLALDDRRALAVVSWVGSRDGGPFEIPVVVVVVFGPDGRIQRVHLYDFDQLAAARACYEKLAATVPPRIENAATRAFQRGVDAFQARDWERFAALLAPAFRNVDRRKRLHGEFDRDEWLVSYRPILEMTSGSTTDVLATRGDRLALVRYRWHGSDGLVGPSEIDTLELIEFDAEARAVAFITFDPDDLDAAYAELDDRYAAGEAAPFARTWERWVRHTRAAAARDWEQLASLFAPDLVVEDHRPPGALGFRSRDEYVASVRALLDLRSDARLRVDHVLALDDRRSLTVVQWEGGEPDGTFEIPAVVVTEHGPGGISRRADLYGLDQLADAWARFAALRPGTSASVQCDR